MFWLKNEKKKKKAKHGVNAPSLVGVGLDGCDLSSVGGTQQARLSLLLFYFYGGVHGYRWPLLSGIPSLRQSPGRLHGLEKCRRSPCRQKGRALVSFGLNVP